MTNPWQETLTHKWHYQAPNLLVCGPFADEQQAAKGLHFELTRIALRRKA